MQPHDEKSNRHGSKLKGELLSDAQVVLVEAEKYLKEKDFLLVGAR
jgi:hypothetical protein